MSKFSDAFKAHTESKINIECPSLGLSYFNDRPHNIISLNIYYKYIPLNDTYLFKNMDSDFSYVPITLNLHTKLHLYHYYGNIKLCNISFIPAHPVHHGGLKFNFKDILDGLECSYYIQNSVQRMPLQKFIEIITMKIIEIPDTEPIKEIPEDDKQLLDLSYITKPFDIKLSSDFS